MLAISDGMTSTVQDNYMKSHAIGRESPWDEAELWQPARLKMAENFTHFA